MITLARSQGDRNFYSLTIYYASITQPDDWPDHPTRRLSVSERCVEYTDDGIKIHYCDALIMSFESVWKRRPWPIRPASNSSALYGVPLTLLDRYGKPADICYLCD